jgi:hypothetical protein
MFIDILEHVWMATPDDGNLVLNIIASETDISEKEHRSAEDATLVHICTNIASKMFEHATALIMSPNANAAAFESAMCFLAIGILATDIHMLKNSTELHKLVLEGSFHQRINQSANRISDKYAANNNGIMVSLLGRVIREQTLLIQKSATSRAIDIRYTDVLQDLKKLQDAHKETYASICTMITAVLCILAFMRWRSPDRTMNIRIGNDHRPEIMYRPDQDLHRPEIMYRRDQDLHRPEIMYRPDQDLHPYSSVRRHRPEVRQPEEIQQHSNCMNRMQEYGIQEGSKYKYACEKCRKNTGNPKSFALPNTARRHCSEFHVNEDYT